MNQFGVEGIGERSLVTGASGFLGRHLVRALRRSGVEVATASSSSLVIPGRNAPHTFEFDDDASDWASALIAWRPQTVFHLATRYLPNHRISDIGPLVQANIDFGIQVAEIASVSRASLLYTASAWQRYGGKVTFPSLYAATKEALSTVLTFYQEFRHLELRQVFLFDTYGPFDDRNKIVSALVRSGLLGAKVRLGSPSKLINLTHVNDVVRSLIQAVNLEPRLDWVIRSSDPIKLEDLVAQVEISLGSRLNIEWEPSLDRDFEMVEDWIFGERLEASDPHSLATGLRTLVAHERRRLGFILRESVEEN